MKRTLSCIVLALAPLFLAGCDMLGIESATDVAAKRDAEGKAIGGACRYSARSIEQCFQLNKRADKAAVFAGWREMNDYMHENKIQAMPAAAASAGADGGTDTAAAAGGAAQDDAAGKGASPADGGGPDPKGDAKGDAKADGPARTPAPTR